MQDAPTSDPPSGAWVGSSDPRDATPPGPTVPRLRIDAGAARARASLDVTVAVTGERVRIDPGAIRIEIRANADWALDVRYRPAPPRAAPPLGGAAHRAG